MQILILEVRDGAFESPHFTKLLGGRDVDPPKSKGLGAKVLGSVASVLRQ